MPFVTAHWCSVFGHAIVVPSETDVQINLWCLSCRVANFEPSAHTRKVCLGPRRHRRSLRYLRSCFSILTQLCWIGTQKCQPCWCVVGFNKLFYAFDQLDFSWPCRDEESTLIVQGEWLSRWKIKNVEPFFFSWERIIVVGMLKLKAWSLQLYQSGIFLLVPLSMFPSLSVSKLHRVSVQMAAVDPDADKYFLGVVSRLAYFRMAFVFWFLPLLTKLS